MQSEFNDLYREYFPFWDALSEDDRDLLCRNTSNMTYKKGINVHDSSECTGAFFVKSGCLRVYILSEDGKEVTLYRLFKGDMCLLSASCVIQSITFDVFVDAEEDTECALLSGITFASVSDRNPAMKIFALEMAVSRFSDVMWVMQQILFMSMDKRLAIFLLDETTKQGDLTVKLTHEQIAKYMGSAREVVSRMLKYFSSEGIVEVSRKGVKVLDRQRLRDLSI